MGGFLAVLLAVVLGCALVLRFTNLASLQPRWAAALVIFGAGSSLGIGLTSILFFLAILLLPATPQLAMWVEIATLGWLSVELFRRRKTGAIATESPSQFPWNWILMAGLILALGLEIGAMSGSWENNPQGNWDAWTIWNARARFLTAGGVLAERAWSPLLRSHPEYPLLTSAFVARAWTYGGAISTTVPIVVAAVFFLALISLVTGGIAAWPSRPLGLLLGLTLAATPTLAHAVPDQYADVPLACYFAGALMLALLEHPMLAGILAGLAAWTKDEGSLFAIVLVIAAGAFRRRHFLRLLAGAACGGAIVVFFKAVLVRGLPSLLGGSARDLGHHLSDPARYAQVIAAMGTQFMGMAAGWYHPILPVLALAVALKFDPERRRDTVFCGTVAILLLVGYFAIYIITPNDLKGQLQTSLGRIYVQLWPVLLITIWTALRAPESTAIMQAQVSRPGNKAKA